MNYPRNERFGQAVRMSRHSELPPLLAGRPFSVDEGADIGLTRGRLRGSDLARPFHGVRDSAAETPDTLRLARAYATAMPPVHYFSHWTAAEILGLRLPEHFAPSRKLDVAVSGTARAPRSTRIHGHQLADSTRVVTRSGLRVSSAIDTWRQLAAVMTLDEVIAMGDGLVCRKKPACTPAELQTSVVEWRHRPGARKLAAALPHIRPRTDSWRETMLRLLIVRAGFDEPVVNGDIRNRYGAKIGSGDLVYASKKVLIEYDGRGHWANAGQFAIDIARLDEFMEEGWRVIRVDKSLMAMHATLFGKIRRALDRG
jgi:hypothetical protein